PLGGEDAEKPVPRPDDDGAATVPALQLRSLISGRLMDLLADRPALPALPAKKLVLIDVERAEGPLPAVHVHPVIEGDGVFEDLLHLGAVALCFVVILRELSPVVPP